MRTSTKNPSHSNLEVFSSSLTVRVAYKSIAHQRSITSSNKSIQKQYSCDDARTLTHSSFNSTLKLCTRRSKPRPTRRGLRASRIARFSFPAEVHARRPSAMRFKERKEIERVLMSYPESIRHFVEND